MTNNAPNNSSSTGTEAKKSNNNRRRRNNNRKRFNKPKTDAQKDSTVNASSKTGGQNNSSQNKRRRNNNKKRNYNKNKGPQLTGVDFITTKYLNLLDQHLQARKKYFENFHRVNAQTKKKLERNYVESQKTLLDFKARLKPEDLVLYESRYECLANDDTYSKNHELNFDAEDITIELDDKYQGPHYLVSQEDSSYSQDIEESSGSIDDYKAYRESL